MDIFRKTNGISENVQIGRRTSSGVGSITKRETGSRRKASKGRVNWFRKRGGFYFQHAETTAKEYHDKLLLVEKELAQHKKQSEKAIADAALGFQRQFEEAAAEAALKNKDLKRKMEAEMETLQAQLEALQRTNKEMKKNQEEHSASWKTRCEAAEKDATTLRQVMESMKAEKDKEMAKMKSEMEQNEDIFSLLEKKYNEQHQKVLVGDL